MLVGLTLLVATAAVDGRVQQGFDHRSLDEILDLYVRDGFVYYAALRIERGKLDRYIAALDLSPGRYDAWSPDDQTAFWVNAYNAFVLRTVIDHYPIRGRAPEYPPESIRQIPGAFEQRRHRAAGRSVTLDEIETTILSGFGEPRVYLALGRGAVGSGRLRSEAYTGGRLASQLDQVAAEFATTPRHIELDSLTKVLGVSAILGWRESDFIAVYDGQEPDSIYQSRSPIERAVLSLISPHLFPIERTTFQANDFRVEYRTFDWRLNDLTGGRPD